ncbi:MAG: caspase family protein [Burkholderiales bacterium]
MKGILTAVLLACVCTAAWAERVQQLAAAKPAPGGERRVALVIGNSAYKSSPLRNPVNDARAMARALAETGFTVTLAEDLSRAAFRRVVRDWGDQLLHGGVGLFYFAGHGMQIRGRNYLIPVNADVQREDEVEDESVDANTVLAKMDSAKNTLNIMILDACRNNPFQRAFRSGAQGLAQMDAPSGTIISFATAPGSVASDGDGENGLYTSHLLRGIREPGLPIEQLFKQVRIGVSGATGDRQIPWESSSLKGDFYFLPAAPRLSQDQVKQAVQAVTRESEQRAAREREQFQSAMEKMIQEALAKQRAELEAQRGAPAQAPAAAPAAVAAPSGPHERQVELAFWDSIKDSANPADFTAYLQRYPQGAFAPIARNRLAVAPAAAAPKPAAAPAQVASIAPVPRPAPAAPAAAAAAAAAPASGSRWQYSGRDPDNPDTKFDYLVEMLGASAAGVLEVAHGRNGSTQWVHGSAPTLVGLGSGFAAFSPLVQEVPLKVGMEWSGIPVVRLDACGRGLITCSADAKVVGRERVTVKAGSFDAHKVAVDLFFRTAFGGGTRTLTFWVADKVGRPVKFSSRMYGGGGGQNPIIDPNIELELVGYQRDGGVMVGNIGMSSPGGPGAQRAAPIVLASAGATQGAAALAGPAVPRPGDRWSYEFKDLSVGRSRTHDVEVTAVGAEGIHESVASGASGTVALAHGPGTYLSGAGFVQFSPYLLAYRDPAQGPVRGDVVTRHLADCAGINSCAVEAVVEGSETVTVPAGTFEARKVTVDIQVQNAGMHSTFGGGRLALTFWYALQARRFVKATGRGTGRAVVTPNFELSLQSFRVQ